MEFQPINSLVNILLDETINYEFDPFETSAEVAAAGARRQLDTSKRYPTKRSQVSQANELRFRGSCHPSSGCPRIERKSESSHQRRLEEEEFAETDETSSMTRMSSFARMAKVRDSWHEFPGLWSLSATLLLTPTLLLTTHYLPL